jgi:hypothetical protein
MMGVSGTELEAWPENSSVVANAASERLVEINGLLVGNDPSGWLERRLEALVWCGSPEVFRSGGF